MSSEVVVALASWCGYSKKQDGLIAEEATIVWCDKDKDHPVCSKTEAYPSWFVESKQGNEVVYNKCHVGYESDIDNMTQQCQLQK